jgi:hypothetical protein
MNEEVIEELENAIPNNFETILNKIEPAHISSNLVSYLIHDILFNPVKRKKTLKSERIFERIQIIINLSEKKLPAFLIINDQLQKISEHVNLNSENEKSILIRFVNNFILENQNIKELVIETMYASEIAMQKEMINKMIKFPVVLANYFRGKENTFDIDLYYQNLFKELLDEEFFVSNKDIFVYFMDKITLNGLLGIKF